MRFVFAPQLWQWGLGISAVTLLLVALWGMVMLWVRWWRARSAGSEA